MKEIAAIVKDSPGILVAVGCLSAFVVLLGIGYAIKHRQHREADGHVKRLTMVNRRLSMGGPIELDTLDFINPASGSMDRGAERTQLTRIVPPPPARPPSVNGW